MRRWRDSLLADHAPATVNRLAGATVAALNLACEHDPRIRNLQAWRIGLRGLPDAQRARNIVLSDDEVRQLIAAAYARDGRLGLFVDVMAISGTRPSQIARLEVGDLRAADLAEPKLLMPRSGKGGGRLRVKRKVERVSVPITAALAVRLKAAAAGRPHDAPLLLWRGDLGWGVEPSVNYRPGFREAVETVGLDPDVVTLYALRHSSVVRQLLRGVPIRLVASLHDTSVGQIESNYSKYISEGGIRTLSRAAPCSLTSRSAAMLFRWRADHGPQGRAAAQAASLLCRPVGFAKRGLHPGESLAWIAPSGGARSPRGHAIGAVGDGSEAYRGRRH